MSLSDPVILPFRACTPRPAYVRRSASLTGPPPEPHHAAGLGPGSPLSECYRRWARPLLAERAKPATLQQYDAAVRHWVRLTGDPPLESIDQELARRFVAGLLQRPGLKSSTLAPATVRKTCVHLGKLFALLGPRRRGRPDAIDELGLWGWRYSELRGRWVRRQPPVLWRPPGGGAEPEPLQLAEISRAMDAARAITRPLIPGRCNTGTWLAALIWWSYCVGTRLGTTLRIRWDWIDGPWLRVPREALKRQERDRRFWLNAQARAAIAPLANSTGLVFAWPCTEDYLKKRLARIQDLAAIPVRGRFGLLHRCRQALATWLMARNPAIAKLQLGHSLAGDVALRHYTDPAIVAELMDNLPWPEVPDWFGSERQGRLF